MILRVNKIFLSLLTRKKSHRMVMLVSMNVVINYGLKPSNARAQHRKQPSVR